MRTFLIIILILIILLLGGMWIYLLLNGAPKSVDDVRKNLFGRGTVTTMVPEQVPMVEEAPVTDRTFSTDVVLLEVTDRAVAGAVIATIASSTVVRYVEKGTGHIYELDLPSGRERRISGTTIPGVVRATWSPLGQELVLLTEVNGVPGEVLLGNLHNSPDSSEIVFDTEKLEAHPADIAFSKDGGTLYFTKRSISGTEGYVRVQKTGTTAKIFTVPLTEISILWDIWDNKQHMLYTKPAVGFMGYLYTITGDRLEKYLDGNGLTAARMDADTLLIHRNDGEDPTSIVVRSEESKVSFLPLFAIREKCARGSAIWCGADTNIDQTFPVSWYQGLVSYNDTMYRVDRATGQAVPVLELETYAREQIDVTDLTVGPEDRLLFKNKRDDSLWLMNPARIPS